LKNLGFNYVDVLLAHWPPCWHNFPACEYARAMEKLVHLGKVNYLGLSDYPVELVESFRSCLAREDVQVLRLRYNLAERWAEKAHIPYAEKHRTTVQAWSPIAKGALTGKYEPGKLEFQDVRSREPIFHPENYSKVWELVKLLRQVGDKYGKKPVQVVLNWLITNSPVVVPIPGTKTPEQVDDLAGAVG
jgi:aryl-alcohol dehydrogenase-like predicted oxidoreductase